MDTCIRCVFSSDALGAMTKVADQLQTNGAEESKAYMQFSAAFFRGVSALPGLCILTVQAAT